ncbi:MAG: hypothetical protein Q7O04_01530 [Candidatus Omnitrophota bacterium]|nr:hypothetical protein [Candidatus Omnitrophota bacterium]
MGDVRYKGGVILTQALHGTWEPVALMTRERFKRGTARIRVPKRGTGADYFVVAMKAGNSAGAKGISYLVEFNKQPRRLG